MTKRVKEEIAGIAVCIASVLLSPALIHGIESMSIAFKTDPAYRMDASVTMPEVSLILISYLFRILPVLIWLLSIKRRILRGSVRKYLEMAVFVALLFITNSYLQHAVFITNFFLHRVTGNLVVLTLLYFPLFAFYAALCIGKEPNCRLKKTWFLLWIPVAVLTVLSLTNEFHFLMFSRLEGEGLNFLFHLNIGMYLCVGWAAGCYISMLYVLLRRGNEVREKKVLRYMPMVFAALFVFLLTEFLEASFAMETELIEAPMGFFMLVAFTWECMIFSGMIQANFYHVQMFHETGIPMALVDENGKIYDSSMIFDRVDPAMFLKYVSEGRPKDGYIYLIHKINAGYVYWKEDVRELEELSRIQKENQSRLLSEAELVRREAELSEEEERQRIQDKIVQDLNVQIEEEIELLKSCIQEYEKGVSEPQKSILLKKINLLMVYIKRYIHLYFTKEQELDLSEYELYVSMIEIKSAFEDADIRTDILVDIQGRSVAEMVLVGLKTWILVLEYFDFQIEKLDIRFVQEREDQMMCARIVATEQCFLPGTEQELSRYIEEKHGKRIQDCCRKFSCRYHQQEIILEMG